MPYCPNCAVELQADAASCPNCKADFGEGSAWKPLAARSARPRAARKPETPRSLTGNETKLTPTQRFWLIFALVYVVVSLVLPGLGLLHRVAIPALLIGLAIVVIGVVVWALTGGRTRRLRASAGHQLRPPQSVPRDHALKLAAECGEADIVREMIDRGARPDGYPTPGDDSEDDSPLIAATRIGSEEIVRMLIAAGADVNRKVGSDDDEWCALECAIWQGHREIAKLLLQHGADATPALPEAIRDVDVELVSLMLQHGADATRVLKEAIVSADADMVKLALQHGADVCVLKYADRPDPEKSAWLMARIGEHRHASDIARAATGLELKVLDEPLSQRAGELGSLFAALAERYKAEGDYVSAKRLCEWKVNRGASLLQTSVCLRVQAQMNEQQGDLEQALQFHRDALSKWQLGTRPEIWGVVGASEVVRTELSALLRDCVRIFTRLGVSEEREHVVGALRRLEGGCGFR